MTSAITVSGLCKRYGAQAVLDERAGGEDTGNEGISR
jgi:hypothetical protein